MLFRTVVALLISANILFGVSQEAKDIQKHYKSLAKDFLIYQFLQKESTTKQDAAFLLKETKRLTPRLKKLFAERMDDKHYFLNEYCKKLSKIQYEKQCLPIGTTPSKFQKLPLKQQKKLYRKLLKKHGGKKTSWMKYMIAKDTFGTLMQKDNGSDFLKIFFGVTPKYRQKVLDKPMSGKFLTKFANQKSFTRFVLHIAMTSGYKRLPNTLIRVSAKRDILSYDSAFYLGLMALQKNYKQKAIAFFQRAQQEAKYKIHRDKALFWQYLASEKGEFLENVAQSEDLNFYSLLAREHLKKPDFKLSSPNPSKEKLDNYSITDPFTWAYTLDYIKDLNKTNLEEFAQKFYTQETLGHYAYMMERVSGYKKNYFVMPYKKYLKDVNLERVVLIYALGRQESRFIPASVSTSYALGMMQFMPFLARATAKDEKIENFKYFDMFEPKTALHFANIHLDYLTSYLYHPLFVAYAYNGGIGFTKRMLTKQKLFRKGEYEPYLSMELVPYRESRKYGKKVLANYVEYAKLNGLEISLTTLLEKLTIPGKSDRFRSEELK